MLVLFPLKTIFKGSLILHFLKPRLGKAGSLVPDQVVRLKWKAPGTNVVKSLGETGGSQGTYPATSSHRQLWNLTFIAQTWCKMPTVCHFI